MRFPNALLLLASVFIVGSSSLNMFVFHLLLSTQIACTTCSRFHITQHHPFPCQKLTAADLVRLHQSLQVAMEDLIELPTPRLLLQNVRLVAAILA